MCGFERRLYMLYVYDIHATVILLAHDSFHIFPFFFLSFFLEVATRCELWTGARQLERKKKTPTATRPIHLVPSPVFSICKP